MSSLPTVGVLTFHRCINYGSYWQARAMVEGLRRRGHQAVLLDHQSPRVDRAEWKNVFQPVLPRRTSRSDYRDYALKARKFFEAFERLPLSPPFPLEDPSDVEPYDVVVVGSDEVWNFRHPWYAGCSLFFGDGLKADRLVSYAASFGCHDATSRLDEAWVERLRRFTALGVRDENSRLLVREGLGEDPALVLDPCLQFDLVGRGAQAGSGDTAIVYGHSFSDGFARAVQTWARSRGVRLVSIGYRNDWADEQWLSAGPEEFAAAMGEARAVITNFFHGCVFALLNDRPFVGAVTEYRRNKIAALLQAVGAEERLAGEWAPQAAFDDALDHPPGEATQARIRELRARSMAYLDHALA